MMNLHVPENIILKPTITVFGVGGAGGNAVNNMINSNLQGASFVVANTDAQALEHSQASNKVQLGASTTRGLGAGADREVGKLAAEESRDEILSHLEGSNMVFITAGMGGGTGTGAAPVIARLAKEIGILTVGVVTQPFHFEGAHRMKTAEAGLEELKRIVDTLIVIPNQNLFRIANERTTFSNAFEMADEVLKKGVQSITDLMIMPGLINLDFADISAVMSKMGKAMMGTGEATGDDRAIKAAEAAISNPLLAQNSMRGAKGVLINITGGPDMTLFEVDAAANRIREEVGSEGGDDTNIIFGSTLNMGLEGIIRVSVVATGIDADSAPRQVNSFASQAAALNLTDEAAEELDEEEFFEEFAEDEDAPVMPEIEAPAFEEYDIGKSVAEVPIRASEAFIGVQAPKREEPVRKPSLFGRMWDSLKGLDGKQDEEENERRNKRDLETVGSSDIYDVPAFLRRK